jgi:hypothetical protein
LSRNWLFLTAPIAIAALALLAWTVASLLRTVRGSVVMSVPIRAEQKLAFDADGDFALNLESPIGVLRPIKLRYALTTADGATRIPLPPIAFRTDVTSMSRSRLELYRFTLPSRGDYILHIDGIDPAVDYGAFTIVIARQYGFALVLHILVLIALGVALIGSIVVSGLILSGKI